jgi:hypothetical protein
LALVSFNGVIRLSLVHSSKPPIDLYPTFALSFFDFLIFLFSFDAFSFPFYSTKSGGYSKSRSNGIGGFFFYIHLAVFLILRSATID